MAETIDTDLYYKLVQDKEEWDMPTIARELAVQHQTVKTWRRESLAAAREAQALGGEVMPHPNALPLPHTIKFGRPVWYAGVIRRWAMQTGRMTPSGVPMRSKPPGQAKKKG